MVRRCTAVEDLVDQDGNFWPDALSNTQPVKADESVGDMVGISEGKGQHTYMGNFRLPPACLVY